MLQAQPGQQLGTPLSVPLAAGEEDSLADDDAHLVEQPVIETDPTGRYSRTAQLLGRGACKTVYKAFDEEEGIEVAWNRVHDYVSSKEERDRLFAEIRVLKQLKHKNIMTFYDSWLDPKTHTINFITELFTSGTLRQYRKRHKQVDAEVLKSWAWQILCGLVYLHGHTPSIIHRDLKCDNIFINGSEGVVKIGDLGLATLLRARTAPQSVLGTPEFMAPELYDEEYDDRVDVYSFGMCLLELATLEYPYCECRNAAQIYRKVTLGVRPASLQRVADKNLAEFIAICISPRSERPRARNLLKHPYFDSMRQEKCAHRLSTEALAAHGRSTEDLVAELAASRASSSSSGSSFAAGSACAAVAGAFHQAGSDVHAASSDGNASPLAALGDAVMTAASAFEEHGNGNGESGSLGITVPMTGQREFSVQGHISERNQSLQLRLRIVQSDGLPKMVQFEFDMGQDTAASVASEMVEEMALSQDDAHSIASAIKNEVHLLTGVGSPLATNAFPPSLSGPSKSLHKPLAVLGSSPLSQDSPQDSIPANTSSSHARSDSARLLYERQQQLHQDHLAEQQQRERQHSDGPAEQWQQQQQTGQGADEDVHNPFQSELGTAEDVFEPDFEPPPEDHPVMHRGALSRMLSPPREELNKVDIKELFTNMQMESDQASKAASDMQEPPAKAAARSFAKSGSSPQISYQHSPPQVSRTPSVEPAPTSLPLAPRRDGGTPSQPATPTPSTAPDRPAVPGPPPHRTHVDRDNGAASPPPHPFLPLSGGSSSTNVSPIPRRQLSPMRKPLGPMTTVNASPFEASAHLARPLSPAPLGVGNGPSDLSSAAAGNDLLRQRSTAEKEGRRKAAADAAMARMKNMEAQSLSGLDTFGLTRGCSTNSKGLGMAAAKRTPSQGQGLSRQSVL